MARADSFGQGRAFGTDLTPTPDGRPASETFRRDKFEAVPGYYEGREE